jgi:tetratricopeptide (TPR) repeat protein
MYRFKEMLHKAKPYNALKTFPISLAYDKKWAKF